MKKLLTLLTLVGSLQAMNTTNNQATPTNSQPNAGAPATDTVPGSQEVDAAATDTPQFKFHLGIPPLQSKAAAEITPEAAEEAYQAQLTRQDQIQNQIQEAEKAGDTKKVAELKKQQNFIPWPVLEKAHQIPQDPIGKIINALKQDDQELLKMAIEKEVDPTTSKAIISPTIKAITLNDFIDLAQRAIVFHAERCLNFLLSRAENIPSLTLNELLTYADEAIISADIIQLLINRGARGEFFNKWNKFPLHQAVIENNLKEVKELIDDGTDVNQLANDMTPLLLVCQYGNDDISFEITKKLLEKNANVNTQNSEGWTPLLLAIANSQTAVAQILIEKNANVKVKGYNNATPLFFASEKGYTFLASLLINRGAEVNATDAASLTPLHAASINGHLSMIKLLLEKNADVNAQDEAGQTPLQYASANDHLSVIKLLLENNANVNAINNDEFTALYYTKDKEAGQLLIDKGANPVARTESNWTPLHEASKNNRVSLIKLLVEHNADVNSQDSLGLTPLHVASQYNHLDTIKLLLSFGAHVDERTKKLETPLHVACQQGFPDVVNLLLNSHAYVDATTNNNETALHIAVSNNHPALVKILINRGANVNALNKYDWTPLHYAAKNNNIETALLLLEHKADPRLTTKNAKTALDILAMPRAEPTDISRLTNILEEALARKQAEVAEEETDALSRKRAKTDADEQAKKTPADVSSFFATDDDNAEVVLSPSTRTKRPAPKTDAPEKKARNK